MAGLARKLVQALPVVDLPGPLGLRLHAASPRSRLSRLADGPPYWAYLWPGGAALAAHLATAPEIVRGLRVLDLGAGGGVVGIAAMRAGAAGVLASEVDPVGREVLRLNAALNGVAIEVLGDLLDGPVPAVGMILVGDLFYEPELAARVLAFLDRAAGVPVLIGDIGRAPLPVGRLEAIADYPVRDVGESAGRPLHRGTVFRLVR